MAAWEIFRRKARAGAETALNWAREHNPKVDIVCDTVRHCVAEHPEYSDLAETHASTAEEVVAILDILRRAKGVEERQKLRAQTAIALMSLLAYARVKRAGTVGGL